MRQARPRAVPAEMNESQFERVLGNAARLAVVGIGFAVLLLVLQAGQVFLAPVTLAIVIGLMFGPVADRLESWSVPPALAAGIVVLLLLGVIAGFAVLFAVPLSEWVARAPMIWARLQTQLAGLKGPLQSISDFQAQLAAALGTGDAMAVTVDDGGTVTGMAMLAPAVLAQIAIFLASLYFFVATRDHIRMSVLSMCVTRRMRWRTAHVFRDVEFKVSRFLLTVTMINLCVGTAVTLAMWAIGMPSPLLWGAMAAVLNYVPYVGQAIMITVLLAVGLGTQTGLLEILLPVICYASINFLEGQLFTPHFIGRTLTLNPFIIFLSITFWIWAWGPMGALIAVPTLLIAQSVITHALPSRPVMPRRPVRRTRAMTDRDELLANAAQVIREQRLDDEGEEARKRERLEPPKGTGPTGVEPRPG
ncbi:AI-2E family transporter [Devosia sp. YIM 151766]|uniref:AI-2E family transporter n=1 Tax=Devosia sp. YIM 151766 TaxID=3017325 RepID=UPI00255CFA57|nr:AI-2E family transporter [Devosia sp. YIM 151766]WIY51774.1 AI-2E family transporter [Devosia sp. YIM 151766]